MSPSPYDLVIGLDRSDLKADLCLIDTRSGQRRTLPVDTAPEALCEWLAQLRQQHPQARVGLCLEQPAVHLVPFLETYAWITLHPINPLTLKRYREAFIPSRANDDVKDADYLADLLLTHHAKLPVWAPEDSATRELQQLGLHRRAVVDERTALTNRLQALLKQYYPQALHLCGEDLWRPLATALLLKWPSLQAVQKARPATLTQFYHQHGSRSQKLLTERLALIANAVPVTGGEPVNCRELLTAAAASGRLLAAFLQIYAVCACASAARVSIMAIARRTASRRVATRAVSCTRSRIRRRASSLATWKLRPTMMTPRPERAAACMISSSASAALPSTLGTSSRSMISTS